MPIFKHEKLREDSDPTRFDLAMCPMDQVQALLECRRRELSRRSVVPCQVEGVLCVRERHEPGFLVDAFTGPEELCVRAVGRVIARPCPICVFAVGAVSVLEGGKRVGEDFAADFWGYYREEEALVLVQV